MSEEEKTEWHSDPAIAKREKRAVALNKQNNEMISVLSQVGELNIPIPRIEKLIEFLVEKGIISYEDKVEEAVAWEEHLRSQIQEPYKQVKRAIELSGVPRQTPGGLIVPGAGERMPQRPHG